MAKFGLIGRSLSHSFSRDYFTKKFEAEGLPHQYLNLELESIKDLPPLVERHLLKGFNVTIPYKEAVIPFLNSLDPEARAIGAVNTVVVDKEGLLGYNTDHWGFTRALEECGPLKRKTALILGTGGASKAIAYTLKELNIHFDFVSRTSNDKSKFNYNDLTESIISSHPIIINCTPVGTYPKVNECPNIPYDGISKNHLLYDLIYNPLQTKFLICGELKGAVISNGLEMLELQAEKAWEIWGIA